MLNEKIEENIQSQKEVCKKDYVIYRLYSDLFDRQYFGVTTNYRRKQIELKTACCNQNNRIYNNAMNKTIRANGGWENWRLVEVEILYNTTKQDAEIRMEYWNDIYTNNIEYAKNYDISTNAIKPQVTISPTKNSYQLKCRDYYIYKVYSDICEYVHIGSCSNISRTKTLFKHESNNPENNKYIYKIIRENGGWNKWNFIIIESLNSVTRQHAEKYAEEWRDRLKFENNIQINSVNDKQQETLRETQQKKQEQHIIEDCVVINEESQEDIYICNQDDNQPYNLIDKSIKNVILNNTYVELKHDNNVELKHDNNVELKDDNNVELKYDNNVELKDDNNVVLNDNNNIELKDYSIYKIYSDFHDDFYIGSTINLHRRIISHKTSCNNQNDHKYNLKIYKTIRENGGWDNWQIVEIDKLINVTSIQARQSEEEWRVKIDAKLNSQRAYISKEDSDNNKKEYLIEYTKLNKEKIYKQRHEYIIHNPEKIRQQRHEEYIRHRERYKETSKKYREENQEQLKSKKYEEYEKNREKYIERAKKYREDNRDAVNKRRTEKIECACGITFSRNDKARHERSLTHKNYIESI